MVGRDGRGGETCFAEVKRYLEKWRREVRRHERACGITSECIDDLEDRLSEAAALPSAKDVSIGKRTRRQRAGKPPVLAASQVILSRCGKSKFFVGGVVYEVELKPLEFALLSILLDSTRPPEESLSRFWKLEEIVNELRENKKYNRPRPTRRSVIAGISRLRETLGSTYRDLVESSPGKGYRLRLLHT